MKLPGRRRPEGRRTPFLHRFPETKRGNQKGCISAAPYIGNLGQVTRSKVLVHLRPQERQIPLDPVSKSLTPFTFPGRRLMQFTVMPFGLHLAPATQ